MDHQQRGRSPSPAHANNAIRHASPHPPTLSSSFTNGDGSDAYATGLNTSGQFTDPSFTTDFSQQSQFTLNNGSSFDHFQQQSDSQADFLHSQNFSNLGGTSGNDPAAFPTFDQTYSTTFDTALDPSLLSADLDPSLDLSNSSLNTMAAMAQSHSPTPPHLVGDGSGSGHLSGSPSPHASPRFAQPSYQQQQTNRPRNQSETLDPSSAMFPQNEWMGMNAYRSHKRTPSDNLSDISSNHAPSPYLGTIDNFEHSSPLLNASNDPTFNDGLGLQQFSLNDQQQLQQSFHSPGHSPGHSPHLMPQSQHTLPQYTLDNNFGLGPSMNGTYGQPQNNGMEIFPGAGMEAFPSLSQDNSSPGERNDHMSPPEINIDFAPPSKMDGPVKVESSTDAGLSPPFRTNRVRAKSDSHAGSRPASPAFAGRGRSPSAGGETLSPFDNAGGSRPTSRSPSPGRGRNNSIGSRARSASNTSDHRDYILDLADPGRSPSSGGESKRVQKHPATFQCTLCPKRFTRAYNLRSHLRTHTDERPFVCTVCGKAFARQHDRKRHEGLHSGEKKFVCRGTLQAGAQWGCGRRFARADALGRHFRSEAGRVCIKPLLDEEAADRQKAWMEEQRQAQVAAGLVAPQPMLNQPQSFDMAGSFLPAALLQQYPALAGLDWNSIPQGAPPDEMDDAYGGRSSFDASSGGEYYEDLSENEMGGYSQDQNMTGMNQMNHMSMQPQMNAYGGNGGTGDYLGGFEGR